VPTGLKKAVFLCEKLAFNGKNRQIPAKSWQKSAFLYRKMHLGEANYIIFNKNLNILANNIDILLFF